MMEELQNQILILFYFGANFEEASKGKQIGTSSEISSQARSHRKRTCGEDESYDKLSEKIGEIATTIKKKKAK